MNPNLKKLTSLARKNPKAAKAFLGGKPTERLEKKKRREAIEKREERFFTESQINLIVGKVVEQRLRKIQVPKDGRTPTRS